MAARDRLGPGLLLALLALSLLAGVLVYRERTPDLALEVPRIEQDLLRGAPDDAGVAHIRFFVRFDEPDALVQIVGEEEVPVRTLMSDAELTARREVVCVWDGRDDAGELVPPSSYRLRVLLPGHDRDMVYPRRIHPRGLAEDADGASSPAPDPPCAQEPARP